jgi:hypothetical protein
MNVDSALDYLDFVRERHRIWEARQRGDAGPWTTEPILASKKFTNVFRILDPGTQFILTDLAADDPDPRDLLLRCFLYRHTGRIEAWRHLLVDMGAYPTHDTLDDVLESWKAYRGAGRTRLKKIRPYGERANKAGGFQETNYDRPLFTAAYLVFPQSQVPGTDKIESIVDLAKRLFTPGSPTDLWPDFAAASSQAERFDTLRRNKGVADFMSMQTLTDWGYTRAAGVDREDEFVVAGPGARRGAAAIDPGVKAERVISWAREALVTSAGCPTLTTPSGATRVPSSMDVQNTLCEFSKWVRFKGKALKPKPYDPAHPGAQNRPVLPEHW